MKRYLIGLGLAAFCQLAAAVCSGDESLRVNVVTRLISPQLNHDSSVAELTEIAEEIRPGLADGLTRISLDATVAVIERQRKKACSLESIDVVLHSPSATVFMAKELSLDSCRYKAVYDHELKHVMLAQQSLDAATSKVRRALLKAIAKVIPEDAQDPVKFTALLRETVSAEVVNLRSSFSAANADLDDHEESLRLERLCGGPNTYVGARLISGHFIDNRPALVASDSGYEKIYP